MANFVDYNQQLLKYKDASKEGFIDANEDPKKAIDPIEITPPNKDGINQNDKNLIEHEKTNLSTPELREFGTGLDYDTYSVDDLTDEEITTRTIINEDDEETQEEIIGPSRQKLRATLAATHDLTMKPGMILSENTPTIINNINSSGSGIDIDSYSVDALTDETFTPDTIDPDTGEVIAEGIVGPNRQKLRTTLMVPSESPNVVPEIDYTNNTDSVKLKNKDITQTTNTHAVDETPGVYQPVGAGFKGVGELIKRAVTPFGYVNNYEPIEANDLTEYKTRTENSITGNQFQMFLYTLVPFVLGQAAEGINALQREVSDVIDDPTALAGQLGTIKNVFFLANYLSYFTIKEMASHLLATPFTLGYLASFGFALKDEISSVKWSRTSLKTKTLAKSWDISELEKNLVSAGGPKNLKEMYTFIYTGIFNDLAIGNPELSAKFSFYGSFIDKNRQKLKTSSETMMISYESILNELRNHMNLVMDKVNKKIEEGVGQENLLKLSNRTENLIKEKKYALEISDFLNIFKVVEKDRNSEKPSGRDSIDTQLTNIKSEHDKNMGIIKASLKNQSSIGYIYVYPSRTDNFSPFRIPFQFNPILNDAGQAARYDAMNMLHRQGQAFSYIQTEGQTLTLETEYLMLSDGKETEKGHDPSKFNNPQDTFYNAWTPKVVQTVELALRSLVLPIAQNSSNGEIMFHKPPMVKIVMGRGSDISAIDTKNDVNNLYRMLMYPLKDGKHYHKTYIVTKVAIIREAETPYYITDDGKQMIDTHGFKVSMDLTEIDHNYVGVAPDFKNFYDVYRTSGNNFLNIG